MYTNAGFLVNEDIDIENYEWPLQVTSCGVYRLLHKDVMKTYRPYGRKDYQLLYISSGKAYFHYLQQDGSTRTILAETGSFAFYKPDQIQSYEYFLEDAPEVYWIHFTGHEAAALLDEIGFLNTPVLSCDISSDYTDLFRRTIRELQLKRPCFEELLTLYLRQLLCRIKRDRLEFSGRPFRPSPPIEEAIHYFNESFSRDINIEEYAADHHISISWFIRSFKHYTGSTPLQYLTSLRTNKAKELLQTTDFPIQEIAKLVGYEDPLYFSRIFKKQMGHAPSRLRREE